MCRVMAITREGKEVCLRNNMAYDAGELYKNNIANVGVTQGIYKTVWLKAIG